MHSILYFWSHCFKNKFCWHCWHPIQSLYTGKWFKWYIYLFIYLLFIYLFMCHATMSGGMLQWTKKYESLKHNLNTEKNLKGIAQITRSNGRFEDHSKNLCFLDRFNKSGILGYHLNADSELRNIILLLM